MVKIINIVINAPVNAPVLSPFTISQDDVTLRNLTIIGTGGDNSGVVIWNAANNTTLDNLDISNFTHGIEIQAVASPNGLSITNNYIHENVNSGIYFQGSVGEISGEITGNIITQNNTGISFTLDGDDYSDLLIYGNYIGTDEDGTNGLGNGTGISLTWAHNSESEDDVFNIGVPNEEPNVISGNDTAINVLNSATNLATVNIQNNLIGLAPNGDIAIEDSGTGIQFSDDQLNLLIGGDFGEEGNYISGNMSNSISIFSANDVTISGNGIGVADDNITAVRNAGGVSINMVSDSITILNNVIAGTYDPYAEGADEEVFDDALRILGGADTENVIIQGNFFGIGLDGKTDIGGGRGVNILSADYLVFGGVNYFNEMDEDISDEEFTENAFDILGQGNIVSNFVYHEGESRSALNIGDWGGTLKEIYIW